MSLLPNVPVYDEACIVRDGSVCRLDVTWGPTKYVYARAKADQKEAETPEDDVKKVVYHKVAGAVQTLCGGIGIIMECPRLVPGETHEAMKGPLLKVQEVRRKHFGIAGASGSIGNDCMRRDYIFITNLMATSCMARVNGEIWERCISLLQVMS